jgi:hypothetical protein
LVELSQPPTASQRQKAWAINPRFVVENENPSVELRRTHPFDIGLFAVFFHIDAKVLGID